MKKYLVRQAITVEAVALVEAEALPDRDTCRDILTRVTLEPYDSPEGVEFVAVLVESAEIRDADAYEATEDDAREVAQ